MSVQSSSSSQTPVSRLYGRVVLRHPFLAVVAGISVSIFFGLSLENFKLDASTESIVLENDPDLRYYNETRKLFGSDDYLIAMVTPTGDLFGEKTLENLRVLRDELQALENVGTVTSILSVPLFQSPPVPIFQLGTGYKTLDAEGVDVEMARLELTESPLYRDHLISADGETTALQINFKPDPADFTALFDRRTSLRDREGSEEGLTTTEARELDEVTAEYHARRAVAIELRNNDIEVIREILAGHGELGEIHMGGVPMIVADIIRYVRGDIVNFSVGVIAFVLVMLAIIFREIRWVVLPTLTSVLTVLIVVGYLSRVDWRMTIVTSNLTSLLLIICIAMSIHVVVRFREIYAGNPLMDKRNLMLETVRHVAVPCLYTSLTTMVGFGSLIVSQIRPVMDFGLMMMIGLSVGYAMCFVFLPAALVLLPRGDVPPYKLAQLTTRSPMEIFARFTDRRGRTVLVCALLAAMVAGVGITRLEVENRFIDYFHESTPIYEGMTLVDERLGGTTPLEVVIAAGDDAYWKKLENIESLREIHEWLEEQPETGKVISPVTLLRILEKVNAPNPVNQLLLNAALLMLPNDIKTEVLKPYVTEDFGQVRIAMRVRESSANLRRQALLDTIDAYFDDQYAVSVAAEGDSDVPSPPVARTTGMFVLYNNMLQSLIDSQVATIAMVFGAIWLMFTILFRSLLMATIAIIPNMLPVLLVLGTLGWLGIPLDMMTVMIAAITLGIAVDNTIHYIHRFKEEFPKDRDYVAAMYRCHNSIGRAIYYTSITIVAGFSILVFSHFIPTVYFGLFTGMAMVAALLAAVTLLPWLLITIKPLGPSEKPD